MFYDFLLTLDTEVRCFWRPKFTFATATYFGIRYTLFIERVVIILEVMWSQSDATCSALTHTDDVLFAINYFAVATFTALRGYAVCGRDWRPLVLIVPLLLVNPIVVLVGTVEDFASWE